MTVDLDKVDLIALVCGTSPNYNLFENTTIKKCGYFMRDNWYWYDHELEKLSEEELLTLYNLCKNSWS